MDFEDLLTDKISVLSKRTGVQHNDIRAAVNSTKISLMQSHPLIEPGDLIIREMSNGGVENFEVVDPGFHEAFGPIPAGYDLRVRKLGLAQAHAAAQSVTYNVHGNNARINNHSIDNSTNLALESVRAVELIQEIRAALSSATLPELAKHEALEVVDEIELQFNSARLPKLSVIKAMMAALPDVATIAGATTALIEMCKA